MDHISLPNDLGPFSIFVPFLAADVHKYNNKRFETFPSRCGFDQNKIIMDKSLDEIMSFCPSLAIFRYCYTCLCLVLSACITYAVTSLTLAVGRWSGTAGTGRIVLITSLSWCSPSLLYVFGSSQMPVCCMWSSKRYTTYS